MVHLTHPSRPGPNMAPGCKKAHSFGVDGIWQFEGLSLGLGHSVSRISFGIQ